MESDRTEIVVHLIRKLGHSLEEIRVRTLRSVVSKLDRELIAVEDLANSRELMANLLEWFNRDPVLEETLVLKLLLRLSAHPSAARCLAEVGAPAFLSQLRPNLSSREDRALAERLLDSLCAVPQAFPDTNFNCHYTAGGREPTDTSIATDSSRTEPMVFRNPLYEDQPTIGYFDRSNSSCSRATSTKEARERLPPLPEAGETRVPDTCVKSPHMPWLPLAPTDRRVLAATLNSLKHTNSKIVCGAVEFTRDVIFLDFPAEVFLQRTSILKALLSALLSGEIDLVRPLSECLSSFCRRLTSRIRYHQNPNNFATKKVFSTKAALGTGMLKNYAPATSVNVATNDLASDFDDIAVSANNQFSIPGLAIELVSTTLSLLGGQFPHEVHPSLMELLQCSLGLLADSLDPNVWASDDEDARVLLPRLKTMLERWGQLLSRFSQKEERTAPQSGLPRQLYVGLLLALLKFCQATLPGKMAMVFTPAVLKDELIFACSDETFLSGHPAMGTVLLDVCWGLEPNTKRAFDTVDRAGRAMSSLCQFLATEDEGLKTAPARLKLASQALEALHFVSCTRFARDFVRFYSDLCTFELFLEGPELCDGRAVLLALLSSSNLHIQKAAYGQAFAVLSECLCTEAAVEPASQAPRRARFLLQRDVIYELATGGLTSANREVATLASSVILALLDGRLLMAEGSRQALDSSVERCLPCLQGHTDLDTRLGRRLIEFAQPPAEEKPFDNFQLPVIKAATRLLFLPCPSARSEAMHSLMWFLLRESRSSEKVGLEPGPQSNWLLLDRPKPLERVPTSRGAYQAEGMAKVLEILFAESVEPVVRKSAGEQVAIFLQNPELHEAFKQRGGVKFVLNVLQRCVLREHAALSPLLTPCIAILRRLCHHLGRLRAELASNCNVLMSLLRVGLAFNYDSQLKYELSHLLVLLLFHEMSAANTWPRCKSDVQADCEKDEHCIVAESSFVLPAAIPQLFQLPFRCPTYDQDSPFRVPEPELYAELLQRPSSQRALRIRWHTACHGDLEQLCKDLDAQSAACIGEDLLDRLSLTELDRYFLHNTLPHLALKGALDAASNASSHANVHAAISRLLLLIRSSALSVLDHMDKQAWLDVFERYLRVQPTVSADYELLLRILDLLEAFMTTLGPHRLPQSFRKWLMRLLSPAGPQDVAEGPLRLLLKSSDQLVGETDSAKLAELKRWMGPRVFRFFGTAVSHLASPAAPTLAPDMRANWESLLSEAAFCALCRFSQSVDCGALSQLGELGPVLELLAHATAQPSWGQDPEATEAAVGLGERLLGAFLHERDDAAVSFIGQHVLRAMLLLLNNIASQLRGKDHAPHFSLWLRGAWLPAFLGFRSPEIRALALCICVKLAGHSAEAARELGRLFGSAMLAPKVPDLPAPAQGTGIWGVALSLLSDATEASSVRTQAAHLLTNLLAQPLPPSGEGPGVIDAETGVLLQGIDALHSLVEHWRLIEVMCAVFNNFYPFPFVVSKEMQSAQRNQQDSSFLSTASTAVLDFNDSLAVTFDSLIRSNSALEAPPSAPSRQRLLHSLSSPSLVAACSSLALQLLFHSPVLLLRHMQELRVPALLMNLLDPELLEAYLRLGRYIPVLNAVCLSYAAILRLLRALCLRAESCRAAVTADSRFCIRVVRMMAQRGAPRLLVPSVLQEAAWLVFALLHPTPTDAAGLGGANLLTPMAARLAPFVASCGEAIEAGGEARRAVMSALAAALACKAAVGCKLLQALDTVTAVQPGNLDPQSSGSALMGQLIRAYDSLALRTQSEGVLLDKYAANNAMKCLLALSVSAKAAAIDVGLVESLIEYVRYLQNKLHLDMVVMPTRFPAVHGVKQPRVPGQREVTLGFVTDLALTLDLLHNLVFGSPEAKQACVDAGLAQTLHRMWTLCQLDDRILTACLRLLINFTANYPPAAASLSFTNPLYSGETPGHPNASCLINTIVRMAAGSSLMETAQRENPVVIRLLYTLLSNSSWSAEARGVMWKSRFLHRFSEIKPRVFQRSKTGQVLQASWLRLLLGLSFSPEGQLLIMRVPDALSILTDQASCVSGRQLFNVLLILRNLSTHAKVRPKLLGAECHLIPCLNRFINENNAELCLVVLSTLQCLLYNNQRAKVSLKTEGFLQTALDLLDRCQSRPDPPEPLFTTLRIVLDAMRE